MRGFGIVFTLVGLVCLWSGHAPEAGFFATFVGIVAIAGSRKEVN